MVLLNGTVEGFVVMLREGVEVALVIGILLASLRSAGRTSLFRWALIGTLAALLASTAGGLLLRKVAFAGEPEILEGALMLVTAAFVASLLCWMWRTGRRLRPRLEARLENLTGRPEATRAALGVFLLAFTVVLREGVETVLLLFALVGAAGSSPPAIALGAGLGFLVAAGLSVLLIRGSARAHLPRFFRMTSLALAVLVAKLVAGGLHEFLEAGLLTVPPFWRAAIAATTHPASSALVLGLLVALPLASLLVDRWRLRADPT